MAKLIAFDEQARKGIQAGVDTLADAVKVTLLVARLSPTMV